MSQFILIREYRQNDDSTVKDIVRQAYLALVYESFLSTLTKEITFQLVVLATAIMFIFVQLPFTYCVASLPLVLGGMYIIIYSTHLFKSVEVFQTKPIQCWVAEACEPFFFTQNPQAVTYTIITEDDIKTKNIDIGSFQRKVIGTVALTDHRFADNSVWIYRLAVNTRYRNKGVGTALIKLCLEWAKLKCYDMIEVAVSENQENLRQMFVNSGFQLRQMYHKQILGNALTLLKYQLGVELNPVL